MKFDELTPQEQEIFMEVAKSKIEDEVFMADGKNYFSLVTKGLVKEIPNANFLAASVILTKEGKKLRDKVLKKENEVEVIFETPQRAITKGQSVVFYDEDGIVLGGGIIS